MKTSKILLTTTLLTGIAGTAYATEWEIDATHSNVQFAVRHMMISTVRGSFDKVAGTVKLDDNDPTKSVIDVTIEAKSINTRDAKRDEHLRNADFFDVAKYPTITFKSKKIEKVGNDKFKATGDLTMRGVTKPVTLMVESLTKPVKAPWGAMVRGVSANGKINRKDWGLTYNSVLETGGVAIGEEVDIIIDAELVQKAATTASK